MRKTFLTMLAMASGIALTGLAAAPANALTVGKPAISDNANLIEIRHGRGHGGFGMRYNRGFGVRHFGGPRFRHRGFGYRHFYRPRFYAPIYAYGSYGSSCQWLKRKAIRTGSRYWWNRYEACRY